MSETIKKHFTIIATTICFSGIVLILMRNEIAYIMYGYDVELLNHFSEQTIMGEQANQAWWKTDSLRVVLKKIGICLIGLAFIYIAVCTFARSKLNISLQRALIALAIVALMVITGYFSPLLLIALYAI